MLGGEEVRWNVFIHFSSYRPFELEDVSELFNSESPFFPLELDTDEVILVAKERVAEIAADRGEASSDLAPRDPPSPPRARLSECADITLSHALYLKRSTAYQPFVDRPRSSTGLTD
jgi:hypothetical protein